MITKEEYTSEIIYEERPINSLMVRFQKRISKDVASWLTYYHSAKKTNHSGWKDNDYFEEDDDILNYQIKTTTKNYDNRDDDDIESNNDMTHDTTNITNHKCRRRTHW